MKIEEEKEEKIKTEETEPEDIVSFIRGKRDIDLDELIIKFSKFPSYLERKIVSHFIRRNPMINIRKRAQDFLLRIVVDNKKLLKGFQILKKAQAIRNILCFYFLLKQKKKGCIEKRHFCSIINKMKKKRGKEEALNKS